MDIASLMLKKCTKCVQGQIEDGLPDGFVFAEKHESRPNESTNETTDTTWK